ncbi:trypsin-like peptidase domain-containing protein [Sorangium sp. So ce291]|uniref:trypsin-like peptidase domain-containing protein n=1 Tax=Sorangium sp. So ce291 TaxID=3133294 RepID=UPI003F5DB983
MSRAPCGPASKLYVRRVGRLHAAAWACVGLLGAAPLAACDDRAAALSPPATPRREAGAPCSIERAELPPAPRSAPPAGGAMPLPALIEQVQPVVVTVATLRAPSLPDGRATPRYPFGGGAPRVERAIGSGVVIAAEGLVLTSDHVVGDAFGIEVQLSDGRAFDATVIGRDPMLDVALLKLLGAEPLRVASLGSSAAVRPGDDVIVVGNPFGLGPTVTRGIISATSRPMGAGSLDGFLQTDAAINPGNSGGPLFNAAGQVIGIATAIHADGRGISFALPIDEVLEVLAELRETGRVDRGRIGISFQEVTTQLARVLRLPGQMGALITEVEPESPGSRLGFKPGDVITSLGGRRVEHARELARALRRSKPGDEVTLTYKRGGADRRATVRLERPAGHEPSPRPRVPDDRGGREAEQPPLGVLASDALEGARIESIAPQSPAAGRLEVGDVVLDLNGVAVRNGADLAARLRAGGRQDLLFRVRRSGSARYVAVPAR